MSEYKGIKTNLPLLAVISVLLFAVFFIASGVRAGDPQNIGALTTPPVDITVADPVTDPITTDSVTGDTDTAVTSDPVTDSAVTEPKDTEPPETAPVTDPPETLGPTDGEVGVRYPNQLTERERVGNEYFKDALFIGDSRTWGLQTSTGLDATFYSKISLNISQLTKTDELSRFITVNVDGTPVKCNVYEALEYKNDYGKVYLCMGLCEMGWNEDVFFDTYRKTLDHIKSKMPGAKIYVQTLFPVTAEYSLLERFGVTNQRVWMYNERLSALADEYGVYLLNPAELFLDSANTLPPGCSPDGMHLYGEYYRQWFDYLCTHAVK